MQDEIDRLYKKLDEQRIWYLEQIADIKLALDNVTTSWIDERKKIISALQYICEDLDENESTLKLKRILRGEDK